MPSLKQHNKPTWGKGLAHAFAFIGLALLVSCGYDDKLPTTPHSQSEDVIDLSFGKPRPGFLNREFKSMTTAPMQNLKLALFNHQITIAGGVDKSMVSNDEGQTFSDVAPLEPITGAQQAFILPDGHFWSLEGRTINRSRAPGKNADGTHQKLQVASLNFPDALGAFRTVLGFSRDQIFLEFDPNQFVIVTFTSDGSPNNGDLTASNVALLPAFLTIQAANLAAGALPENGGYWIIRGPYTAALMRTDNDPAKPYTWRLYDNHIKINSPSALVHMAMNPIMIEGQWGASGRSYALTADAFWRSATAVEIQPNFAQHIKPISLRVCETCHDTSKPLDTEDLWIAHREAIIDRISRPVGDPARMPPPGVRGFTQDDRELILEYLKAK